MKYGNNSWRNIVINAFRKHPYLSCDSFGAAKLFLSNRIDATFKTYSTRFNEVHHNRP